MPCHRPFRGPSLEKSCLSRCWVLWGDCLGRCYLPVELFIRNLCVRIIVGCACLWFMYTLTQEILIWAHTRARYQAAKLNKWDMQVSRKKASKTGLTRSGAGRWEGRACPGQHTHIIVLIIPCVWAPAQVPAFSGCSINVFLSWIEMKWGHIWEQTGWGNGVKGRERGAAAGCPLEVGAGWQE